ncbi:anti-repressor SinI family protein [Ammoniphilus resinae]|uniref:DNA-binding transcriptional MerR regulator n=1 Tax=Ammoniphilus resinae TaxID=861532 RepID=A0ABS4GVQ0_9BACL|nr:anti-repressor SinI family protein [Ammoniphilus resinae]MBP1934102.1 DNA-binding transcriptional MerR regulator [Ammoniphilus resinae]
MEVEEKEIILTVDEEWVELLKLARDMGITPEEVRAFLRQSSKSVYQSA